MYIEGLLCVTDCTHIDMTRCVSSGCLLNLIASTWVEMYHAVFINTAYIMRENDELQMAAIKASVFLLRVYVHA